MSPTELKTRRKERKPRSRAKKNDIHDEVSEKDLTTLHQQQAKRKCRNSDDSSANEDTSSLSKARKISTHSDNSIEVIDIKSKSKKVKSCIDNGNEVINVDIENQKDNTSDNAKKEKNDIEILNPDSKDMFEKESNLANFEDDVVVVSDGEEDEIISETIVELEKKKAIASLAIFGEESDDVLANLNTDSYNCKENKESSSHNKQKECVSPENTNKLKTEIRTKEVHACSETAFEDESDDFFANLEPISGNSRVTHQEKDKIDANTESETLFEDGNDDFLANLDPLGGNSKFVNHNHEKDFVSPQNSKKFEPEMKSNEVNTKSIAEALISHLESSPTDILRDSKKVEESFINISNTDLLKTNMDDIVAEGKF